MKKIIISILLILGLISLNACGQQVEQYELDSNEMIEEMNQMKLSIVSVDGTIQLSKNEATTLVDDYLVRQEELLGEIVDYLYSFEEGSNDFNRIVEYATALFDAGEEAKQLYLVIEYCEENTNVCIPDRLASKIVEDYDEIRNTTSESLSEDYIEEVYEVLKDGTVEGYFYVLTGEGYGSDPDGLTMVIGIDRFNVIQSLEIKEDNFVQGFTVEEDNYRSVIGTHVTDFTNIDFVSGATISVFSVEAIINNAITYHQQNTSN